MFSFGKIAAVGDADLLFGLRALGVQVFSPKDVSDARQILAKLEREKYLLCLVHQEWLEVLSREKEMTEKKLGPVIVGFSDYKTLADTIEKMVKEMAVKAMGSDSFIRRKEKDESS